MIVGHLQFSITYIVAMYLVLPAVFASFFLSDFQNALEEKLMGGFFLHVM